MPRDTCLAYLARGKFVGMDATNAREAIRSILRTLSDVDRAEVIRDLIGPASGDEQRHAIDSALRAAGDSVTGAAVILGCSRRTLMVRMRELGYPPRVGGGRRKQLL